MNSSPVSEREHRRLARVASEYRERGYEVKLQPPPTGLPDFLRGLQPDLVATGRGESVVVEITERNEFDSEQGVRTIEAAVRDRPGRRFELIIVGSEFDRGPEAPAAQISRWINQANELEESGHIVAGLLLLWSATEAVLRLLADRQELN
jgi:hypothetical protein